MTRFLGIASLAALMISGCTDTDGGDGGSSSTVSVQVSSFDEESVAAALGAGWERVEEGVFERPGDGMYNDRVAFGDAGRRAELERSRAALAEVEAAPASEAQRAEVERLRQQVTALQAERVQNAWDSSSCDGTTFTAQALIYSWWYDYTAYAVNQRSGNVDWNPYAYVARYDNNWNPWFPIEGYDDPISAQLTTYPQPGCDLVALARIDVPQCSNAFLYVEAWGSCSE